VNVLYQFSLDWFKQAFISAMELTNSLKGSIADKDGDEGNPALSIEDRVELLTSTLT
jgi:hypothetical protein